MKKIAILLLLHSTGSLFAVHAHDIGHYDGPNVAVAHSVRVPAGSELIFLSGIVADAADTSAPPGSVERFGDTATQVRSILAKLQRQLAAGGLGLADIVKMNVYVLGDPRKEGAVDLTGLMGAYTEYFGTSQGNLPARTTLQVAGLRVPGVLVEVEVIVAHRADH